MSSQSLFWKIYSRMSASFFTLVKIVKLALFSIWVGSIIHAVFGSSSAAVYKYNLLASV